MFVVLIGCSGSQAPMGAPGAMPVTSATVERAVPGRSWMLPEAASEDLLYAGSRYTDSVYVFNYANGKLVGTLTGIRRPQDLCSDKNGNVWVTEDTRGSYQAGQIEEYAHGHVRPLVRLKDERAPLDCSVDPKTGDLAVANADGTEPDDHRLAVYTRGKGVPRYYKTMDVRPMACSYDNLGNLYVTGGVDVYKAGIVWLEKGADRLAKFPLHPFIYPHYGVQWDGKELAIAQRYFILYRYVIQNHEGVYPKEIELDRASMERFWIQGSTLIASNTDGKIRLWRYPAGGHLQRRIAPPANVYGVTVSLAPH